MERHRLVVQAPRLPHILGVLADGQQVGQVPVQDHPLRLEFLDGPKQDAHRRVILQREVQVGGHDGDARVRGHVGLGPLRGGEADRLERIPPVRDLVRAVRPLLLGRGDGVPELGDAPRFQRLQPRLPVRPLEVEAAGIVALARGLGVGVEALTAFGADARQQGLGFALAPTDRHDSRMTGHNAPAGVSRHYVEEAILSRADPSRGQPRRARGGTGRGGRRSGTRSVSSAHGSGRPDAPS